MEVVSAVEVYIRKVLALYRFDNFHFFMLGSYSDSDSGFAGLHLPDRGAILRSSFGVFLLSPLHLSWNSILPCISLFQGCTSKFLQMRG